MSPEWSVRKPHFRKQVNISRNQENTIEKAEVLIEFAVDTVFPEMDPSKRRDLCFFTASFLHTMGKHLESSPSIAASRASSELPSVELQRVEPAQSEHSIPVNVAGWSYHEAHRGTEWTVPQLQHKIHSIQTQSRWLQLQVRNESIIWLQIVSIEPNAERFYL